MTHHEDSSVLNSIVELLAENGFDGMAQAMQILLNEAMKLERSAVLGAGPYQRTESRCGYANGFKPKSVKIKQRLFCKLAIGGAGQTVSMLR